MLLGRSIGIGINLCSGSFTGGCGNLTGAIGIVGALGKVTAGLVMGNFGKLAKSKLKRGTLPMPFKMFFGSLNLGSILCRRTCLSAEYLHKLIH